eukprot:TRINITY_DN9631_c0_g1_i1.p1 TRINITY_DN9631_c0_g1~~TRINITY_DN9631_c0_g1_i1.p1  ORF type:complete len:535 (-),score=123.63 TRINITY_DN9631_c0_g1_i1:3-1382(-)
MDGVVFDITNILPWLKKYKIDPITGKPLSAKDLIPLHFHKNEAGKYHCPITFKEFTEHTHIVAIKTSGHVYSWDAIEQLNIKPKNMKDLLTDTPFTRADIITIQDPMNLQRRNLANFHYIKTGMKINDEEEDPLNNIVMSEGQKRMLRELNEKHKQEVEVNREKRKEMEEAEMKAGEYTYIDASSLGFTSSSFSGTKVKVDARLINKQTDKKGYVRLHTTAGDLNLELHCDATSKTCENFLTLSERGYYNNTIFHRLIPGFMIQGGDPTGTGKGGESIWKKPFGDEFSMRLQHSARGVVSMANSGPDSNKSQFFITFGPCSHLDKKHTVFGKVVGGNETLTKMEQVPTDAQDRPLKEIKILKVSIFVNPFKEDPEEEERLKKKKEEEEKEKKEGEKRGQWYSNPAAAELVASKPGVGKYIKTGGSSGSNPTTGVKRSLPSDAPANSAAKKPQFGDFSKG